MKKKTSESGKGHSKKQAVSQLQNDGESEGATLNEREASSLRLKVREKVLSFLAEELGLAFPLDVLFRNVSFGLDVPGFTTGVFIEVMNGLVAGGGVSLIRRGGETSYMLESIRHIDADANCKLNTLLDDLDNAVSCARGLLILIGDKYAESVRKQTTCPHPRLEADALDRVACDVSVLLGQKFNDAQNAFMALIKERKQAAS